jgi:hypothetical protein
MNKNEAIKELVRLVESSHTKELTLQILKEKEEEYPGIRLRLQKWTNGGTPYIDEGGTPATDGEVGGPSSYEAWRAGINDTKRKERVKQEQEDRDSPFASPKHTIIPDPATVLDDQVDEYLAWWSRKFGE